MTFPVSILISTHNNDRHVAHAIDSALAQDAAEVIVCDDHSTDGTVDIINGYGNIVKLTLPDTLSGSQANRNYLLSHATQHWVKWLDGDDFLYPNTLGTITSKIHSNQAAYTDYLVITQTAKDGVVCRPVNLPDDPYRIVALWEGLVQTNTLIIPRHLHPQWKPKQARCQDMRLFLDLLKAGVELVHIPLVACAYRCGWRQEQISYTPEGKREARINIQQDFYFWASKTKAVPPQQLEEWHKQNDQRLIHTEQWRC